MIRSTQVNNSGGVSVLDFGLVGDGSANNSAKLTEVFTYSRTKKNSLFFPSGNYKGVAELQDEITVKGDGPNNSFITANAIATGTLFYTRTDVPLKNVTIEDISIDSDKKFIQENGFLFGVTAMTVWFFENLAIRRVNFLNTYGVWQGVFGQIVSGNTDFGKSTQSKNLLLEDCAFDWQTATSLEQCIIMNVKTVRLIRPTFKNTKIFRTGALGLFYSCEDVVIDHPIFEVDIDSFDPAQRGYIAGILSMVRGLTVIEPMIRFKDGITRYMTGFQIINCINVDIQNMSFYGFEDSGAASLPIRLFTYNGQTHDGHPVPPDLRVNRNINISFKYCNGTYYTVVTGQSGDVTLAFRDLKITGDVDKSEFPIQLGDVNQYKVGSIKGAQVLSQSGTFSGTITGSIPGGSATYEIKQSSGQIQNGQITAVRITNYGNGEYANDVTLTVNQGGATAQIKFIRNGQEGGSLRVGNMLAAEIVSQSGTWSGEHKGLVNGGTAIWRLSANEGAIIAGKAYSVAIEDPGNGEYINDVQQTYTFNGASLTIKFIRNTEYSGNVEVGLRVKKVSGFGDNSATDGAASIMFKGFADTKLVNCKVKNSVLPVTSRGKMGAIAYTHVDNEAYFITEQNKLGTSSPYPAVYQTNSSGIITRDNV